ncbi:MAG: alpha/beta fold hydrolase [Alphaproteobacteria bacterium]|nr:alpha/beta fold hydrolase [Alphaproteobacteria bacterium]
MGLITSVFLAAALATSAADAPPRQEGDFVVRDFRFHTGETLPELKQHYVTLGDPKNPAVLVLHGTNGNGAGLLNAGFGGELFGPGQPLDASRYFIILPDCLGTGKSSKPSDGLRMKFPRYTYDDMIAAQHRLLTERLGVKHLKLVTGNSMGGMLVWTWGEAYPDFMDGLVPLASTPTAMASRNWAMRRLMIETIKADPAFHNGDYTSQPTSLKYANALFSTATSGGTLGWQARAGTHAEADKLVDQMLAGTPNGDANDTIYQFDASRDYNPEPRLDRIRARVLAVNSADDERNPQETGVMEKLMKRLAKGSAYLIPASEKTRGHGTTGQAALWKAQLAAWLAG